MSGHPSQSEPLQPASTRALGMREILDTILEFALQDGFNRGCEYYGAAIEDTRSHRLVSRFWLSATDPIIIKHTYTTLSLGQRGSLFAPLSSLDLVDLTALMQRNADLCRHVKVLDIGNCPDSLFDTESSIPMAKFSQLRELDLQGSWQSVPLLAAHHASTSFRLVHLTKLTMSMWPPAVQAGCTASILDLRGFFSSLSSLVDLYMELDPRPKHPHSDVGDFQLFFLLAGIAEQFKCLQLVIQSSTFSDTDQLFRLFDAMGKLESLYLVFKDGEEIRALADYLPASIRLFQISAKTGVVLSIMEYLVNPAYLPNLEAVPGLLDSERFISAPRDLVDRVIAGWCKRSGVTEPVVQSRRSLLGLAGVDEPVQQAAPESSGDELDSDDEGQTDSEAGEQIL